MISRRPSQNNHPAQLWSLTLPYWSTPAQRTTPARSGLARARLLYIRRRALHTPLPPAAAKSTRPR